jgi:hypothetical protein
MADDDESFLPSSEATTPVGKSNDFWGRQRKAARGERIAAHQREWQAFPDLPGVHLSWTSGTRRTFDLVASDGTAWATVRPRVGSSRGWIQVSGRTYRFKRLPGSNPLGVRAFAVVDPNGRTVFEVVGVHRERRAGTILTDRRRQSFRFPVDGVTGNPSVMLALPDVRGDDPIVRYRLNTRRRFFIKKPSDYYCVEVVVSPAAITMPDIALFVGATSHLLRRYFHAVPTQGSGA